MENPIAAMEALIEEKQSGQKRQDGTSNATHVKRVRRILMQTLAEVGELPAHANAIECSALGHDLLEDTDVTQDELLALVGPEALGFIKEMTNTEGDAHTAQYVGQMVAASEEARLIKYADLIDNTMHASYQAAGLGLEWMQSFFLPIIDPMAEALSATEFTRYPKTASLLRGARSIARAHLDESLRGLNK